MKLLDTRAMSSIVATLLIVMLTLVAIAIIWIVIRNVLSEQMEIIEVKKEFFSERMEIISVVFDGSNVALSLRRIGRESSSKTETITIEEVINLPMDTVSVVDLSGSMVSCLNVLSSSCCTSTLRGSYNSTSKSCHTIPIDSTKEDKCVNTCGGVWADRLTPTKEANKQLLEIIDQVEGSQVGLSVYNTSVISSWGLGLTTNKNSLNNKIDLWIAKGGTCICCGINDAVDKLKSSPPEKLKAIIVMSDGEANEKCAKQNTGNSQNDAIKAAQMANETLKNLTIYSIGFGEGVDFDTLDKIAEEGNGVSFQALDLDDLIEVYTHISQEIIRRSIILERFNYLYAIFYNENSQYKEKILELPETLQTKTYMIDLLDNLDGETIRIEIYPVIVLKSGKEEIGPLFDTWKRPGH